MTADELDAETADEPAAERGERARELVGIQARFRALTLRAGAELRLFDVVGDDPQSAAEIAAVVDSDAEYTARLLRALAHYGVMTEDTAGEYTITDDGRLFRADGPLPARDPLLFFWHPDYLAAWGQLPNIVSEGGPDGFVREFGEDFFAHQAETPDLAAAFNGTMTAGGERKTREFLAALDEYDFGPYSTVCDVGGGHGHLLSHLLEAEPHLDGVVLEIPRVVAETDRHIAAEVGVDDRVEYVSGDMFETVPEADVYVLQGILHDWSDEQSETILSTIRAAVADGGRLFVSEPVLPPAGENHPAIPSDINMMVIGGRERTESEFRRLFSNAGWDLRETWGPTDSGRTILEATPS